MPRKKKQELLINILDEKNDSQKQFNYEESFRHIRANIEFSNVDEPVTSVLITSTQANEAKTTTAVNLAFIFAAKYEKVLLIDCDLRKHQLNQYMNLSNHHGLTDLIFDYGKKQKINQEYIQSVEHTSFMGNLSVLSAGAKVPNPSEVLSSNLFKIVINELKKKYDFIIIDCPPVGMVTDAIPIGNMVDGAIFVVSAQDTKRKDAATCVQTLQRNNVKVLGSILTKADIERGSYYYNYYY